MSIKIVCSSKLETFNLHIRSNTVENVKRVLYFVAIDSIHQRRKFFFTALLWGYLFPMTCLGQKANLPVTIPIRVVAGLLYMQGEVDSSATLNIALDCGAGISIISPSVAKSLGLTSNHYAEAAGIAKGSDQTAYFVDDCELKWGSPESRLSLFHQYGAIFPLDYISAQVGGKPVDALFGSNLFLHYTITVDYEKQIVTFSSSDSGASMPGFPLPIRILKNECYVEASIEGDDGKKIMALFLVDNGTTRAMILNKKFFDAHPGLIAPNHFVETPEVTAVGGVIDSKRAQIQKLSLGPFLLSKVVAYMPDSSTGPLADSTVAGFIGADILRRFTVTWDYTGKHMFLLPNQMFGKPFDTDASGLHLVSPGPQYQQVLIGNVLPHSPAAKAGLEKGDEILSVDGVSGLPLWKVSDIFRKAGTSVVLTVQRGTAILKITLPLRSPFER